MLSNLFRQLIGSFGVVLRTFRAFFMRQIMGIRARARRITSFSRQAAKLVPKAMNSVAVAGKKPTKREDFVETKRLFVAKSFIFLFIAALVALALLVYFIVWPWLVSKFFTKRFTQGAEALADYSGKVIVCYDDDKDEPMFEVKLDEGVASGQAKEFDELGRVVYEGTYANGLREGKGKLYSEGVLVYDGDFAGGTFDGKGKLYNDGKPLYEGSFVEDAYEGNGKLYDANGELVYDGAFVAGRKSGTGTEYMDGSVCFKGTFTEDVRNGAGKAYYPSGVMSFNGEYVDGLPSGEGMEFYESGAVKFKGNFLAGNYDGEGTLYTQDSLVLYTGGFMAGLYSGEGSLRLDDSKRVEGTFELNEPVGEVEIFRDNRLWYSGEVASLVPNGAGRLYSSKGELIYEGNMIDGVADIGGLLELPAGDVRAMFGEAELIETPGEKAGFSINNEALGVTLFCTYKQESDDPTVYYVYAYDRDSDAFVDAMPYRSAEEYEAVAQGYEKKERDEKAVFTGGVPYPDGEYHRTAYYYEDYVFVGWSEEAGSEWLMVEWITLKSLPPAGEAGVVSTGASQLDGTLASLGLAGDGAAQAAQGEARGDGSLADALKRLYAVDKKNSVLYAAAEYYAGTENLLLYEEAVALYTGLLTDELRLVAMGTGDEARVAQLEATVNRLELSAAKAKLDVKRAENAAVDAGIAPLEELDVTAALICADPAALAREELIAKGGAAAEEAFMELDVAWLELTQALDGYTAAKENAVSVLADYAAGRADEAVKADAVAAALDAAAKVNSSIAACTGLLLKIDVATNGALADALGYFTD